MGYWDWEFVVEGEPVPMQRARLSGKNWKFYTPKKTRVYEKIVWAKAQEAGMRRLRKGEVVEMELEFYGVRARMWDIDNVEKSVLDGLRKFFDDRRVFNVWKRKKIVKDKGKACVLVRVRYVKEEDYQAYEPKKKR